MAPRVPNTHNNLDNDDSGNISRKDTNKRHGRRYTDTDRETLLPDDDGPRKLGVLRQIAMCGGVLSSDGGLVFMQLAMLPTLQTLGVPVASVTLPGCVSGVMALLGLPLLGWLSDGGSSPQGRKKPAVVVSALVFVAGFCLVISGCGFHVVSGAGSRRMDGNTFMTANVSFINVSTKDLPNMTKDIITLKSSIVDVSPMEFQSAVTTRKSFGEEIADPEHAASLGTTLHEEFSQKDYLASSLFNKTVAQPPVDQGALTSTSKTTDSPYIQETNKAKVIEDTTSSLINETVYGTSAKDQTIKAAEFPNDSKRFTDFSHLKKSIQETTPAPEDAQRFTTLMKATPAPQGEEISDDLTSFSTFPMFNETISNAITHDDSTRPIPKTKETPEDPESAEDWTVDPLGLGIPLAGLLAILGFAFIDMGNDLNNSSQKSYVLACTCPLRHVSLLVVGVQMSALGGCVAAMMGVTDVAGWLTQGSSLDTVPGKTLLQCGMFAILTGVCVMATLLSTPSLMPIKIPDMTSSVSDVTSVTYTTYGTVERHADSGRLEASTSHHLVETWVAQVHAFHDSVDVDNCRLPRHISSSSSSLALSTRNLFLDEQTGVSASDESLETLLLVQDEINGIPQYCPSELEDSNSFTGSVIQLSMAVEDANEGKECISFSSDEYSEDEGVLISHRDIENTEDGSIYLIPNAGTNISTETLIRPKHKESNFVSHQTKQLALICVTMFCMTGAWQSYNVCITDYLGKVMYQGDPDADPDSQSYAAYQLGMRTGSLGVLVLNVVYVMANFVQRRLLALIGPKKEQVAVCVLQVAALSALLLTDNTIAYYVTSCVFGIFRSAMYTIPFMLANEICQREAQTVTGTSKAKVGSVIALVTCMIPLSNLLVSSLTGPLLSTTGDPTSPLFYTLTATTLSALVFVWA